LAGAALGFLRHNFPPSRIIMGDSGAYFFGFVLAACSILANLKTSTAIGLLPAVVAVLLVFLLPLLDTFQVVLRRLVQRKNPLSSPGRDHLHHRLLARGLSQTRTTLILWALILLTNLVSMIVQHMRPAVIATTTLGTVLLLGLMVLMRRRGARRREARRAARVAAGLPEDTMEFADLAEALKKASTQPAANPDVTLAKPPPPLVAPPRESSTEAAANPFPRV